MLLKTGSPIAMLFNLAFTELHAERTDHQSDPIGCLAGGLMQMTGEYEPLYVDYEPNQERHVLDLTKVVLDELPDASISDSSSDDASSGDGIME